MGSSKHKSPTQSLEEHSNKNVVKSDIDSQIKFSKDEMIKKITETENKIKKQTDELSQKITNSSSEQKTFEKRVDAEIKKVGDFQTKWTKHEDGINKIQKSVEEMQKLKQSDNLQEDTKKEITEIKQKLRDSNKEFVAQETKVKSLETKLGI